MYYKCLIMFFLFLVVHLPDSTNIYTCKYRPPQVIKILVTAPIYNFWKSQTYIFFRFQELMLNSGKTLPLARIICLHLPFFILFTMQVFMAYFFWLAYGTLAFILGPLRTWSLVLAAVLYYQALHLNEKNIR